VKLDPLKVGEPDTLTVAGNNTITLTDVLVGEVWVGSGQSNIDTSVITYTKQDLVLKEAAEKINPKLRLYHCPRNMGWQETKPDASANYNNLTVSRFSAQLFYFGFMLQKELDVPIGVIQSAKAGTIS
jgi:sialate O-acetylesterase